MVLVYLVPGNMGYQVRVRYYTPWNFVLFNICTAAFPMNKKNKKQYLSFGRNMNYYG